MSDRQSQQGGSQSFNYQAAGNINVGVTADEVMRIAQQTVDANMEKLRGVAGLEAERRVREMLRDVGYRLEREPGPVINNAATPEFQFALLDAEKSYARTGDQDLKSRLTDLLIDQNRRLDRSLTQIVLGEALRVAPSIPQRSFDTLAVLFLLKNVRANGQFAQAELGFYLKNTLLPVLENWPPTNVEILHLSYTGCLNLNLITSWDPVENGLCVTYKDLLGDAPPNTVKSWFNNIDPHLARLLVDWDKCYIKAANLTPVGIALAHNHVLRKQNVFPTLEEFFV